AKTSFGFIIPQEVFFVYVCFYWFGSLYNKGINLVFLKEPYINTDTYRTVTENTIKTVGNDIADIYIDVTNKVLMLLAERQIRQAFEQSQKEVDYLHQRTLEEIETARRGPFVYLPFSALYFAENSLNG
ncbi:MAG: hypothetical protein K2N56_07995, partial [Oscillospiraceae bacterium]|nr:hypothetical protein [Oscillospiraceae bacterium]